MHDPFEFTEPMPPGSVPYGAPPLPYLDGLNEAQRAAVEAIDGPVLVLAGAGTGKTRVLTTRLAHILFTHRDVRPYNLLAVTFTNKAAREMRERVAALIGPAAERIWLGTFHALCTRILRGHAELVGLKSNFTILDADDQIRLLKQLIQAEGIDEKRWPARAALAVIQRWKDKGLTPDAVPSSEVGEFAGGRILELYRLYQARLSTLNAADFGDLLLHCLTLFTKNEDVLRGYQQRFRYILVDEYQDTNVAQYLWLRLLARAHRNICCVGDDDQSVYSWRGAEVGNILRFEADFPGARVVRLERNYRSTPHILAAASGLIAHNQGRLGKTLWTEADGGEKVVVRGVWDGEEEARWVCDEIEASQRKGHGLDQIAILVRAGFQMREFEERLITTGIPYRVVGGPRFYERQEIRDALAYFRVTVQPDDGLAFERILNVPKRGLADASLQLLHRVARARDVSLMEAARSLVGTDELKPKPRKSLSDLIEAFDRWRAMLDGLPHAEVAATILDESGYTEMWQRDTSPEAPGRLENLRELVGGLEEYPSLPGFLEHVSLVMDNDSDLGTDKVTLMTLHAAKGLEFDTVFLPGWEEGLFPHQRALDESGLQGLEEERRLAYVGLTRARKRAVVCFAANRRMYSQWQTALPSRFVAELPAEHVERLSELGVYGGAWGGSGERGAREIPFDYANAGFRSGGWPSRRGGTPMIEGEARVVDPGGGEASGFKRGQRVLHDKFGPGTVALVEGNKLEIDFDKAGRKKVVDSFVKRL